MSQELSAELDVVESDGKEEDPHQQIRKCQVFNIKGMDSVLFSKDEATRYHESIPNHSKNTH
jgi:hypothetical protein